MPKTNFRLTAASRTLGVAQVARLTENETRDIFATMRWGEIGIQECQDPGCGERGKHYWVAKRKQWRCRACGSSFSVTTNTAFADHKLTLNQILLAINVFASSPKGISAIQMAHAIITTPKTAWVLLHKIRESIIIQDDPNPLKGEVEADGARFNHTVRKHCYYHPGDRRRENAARRDVIVMRERGPVGEGAVRTKTFVVRREDGPDTVAFIRNNLEEGTHVFTDGAPIFGHLANDFALSQVNHTECFQNDEGINQNQAESYFSRMRRGQYGQYHRMSPQYLGRYAAEMGFREDWRKKGNRVVTFEMLNRSLHTGTTSFRGYWQRRQHARNAMRLVGGLHQ